jgi:hypothetical protein
MRPHPLGVLPEGNRYLVSPEAAAASARARLEGLGAFAALPDALLMRLLSGGDEDDGVGAEALASLCLVSRVFRAFACHEDLWKAEVLRRDGGAFVFRGASWRETYRRGVSAAADRAGDDGRDDARDDANDSPNIHHSRHPRIFSDALYSRHLAMHRPLDKAWLEKETIPVMRVTEGVRTEAQTKALASEFVDAYEKKNAPVILRGACAEWEAVRNDAWSLPALRRRLTNENVQTFHVGGYEVPLKNWERYCEASRPADEGGSGPVDDAPLYLFDKNFVANAPEAFRARREGSPSGYEPPRFICSESDDLFSLLPNRPDYRWFIHGPARSGSLFHVDPNGTSAWNAVARGAKRWILFNPNGSPPPGVHPSVDGATVAQPVTLVEWYASFYEHAYPESDTESDSEEEESAGSDEDSDAPTKTRPPAESKKSGESSKPSSGFLSGKRRQKKTYDVLEGTCFAGDVLFVPSGWWHAALNLTETAAVTQNFCSPRTAPKVLRFLKRAAALGKGGDASESLAADLVSGLQSRDARGSLYADFLEALRKHRPDVLRLEEVRRVLGEDGRADGEEEKEEKEEDGDGGGTRRRQVLRASPSVQNGARKKPRLGETSPSRFRETTETTRGTNALAGLFAAETRAESKGFAFGFKST